MRWTVKPAIHVKVIEQYLSFNALYSFVQGNAGFLRLNEAYEGLGWITVQVITIVYSGLEIISGESPDTMTGQIHFSSVLLLFFFEGINLPLLFPKGNLRKVLKIFFLWR